MGAGKAGRASPSQAPKDQKVDIKINSARQRWCIERKAAALGLDESTWVRTVIIELLGWQLPEDAIPVPAQGGHITARITLEQRQALEELAGNGGQSFADLVLPVVLRRAGWTAKDDPDFKPRYRRVKG